MKRNRQNEKGAVAVLTAVLLLAAVMAGAAAIDIGKAMYVRSNLQRAVDAAVKAAAADAISESSGKTNEEIAANLATRAKIYIAANAFPPTGAKGGLVDYDLSKSSSFRSVYTPTDLNNPGVGNEDSVSVTLNATVPVTFSKLFVSSIPVSVTSTAKRPRPAPVELVIALDNTSSMDDNLSITETKLDALRVAAKELVTSLMKWNNVRVGIVPFSGYIKLDSNTTSYFNKTSQTSLAGWLTFTPRRIGGTTTKIITVLQCTETKLIGCVTVPKTCYKDGVPYSCDDQACNYECTKSEWVTKTVTTTTKSDTWNGCLWVRPPPEINTISNTVTKPYYGIWNADCGVSTVTDLVSSTATFSVGSTTLKAEDWLNARIDALSVDPDADAVTYIPNGLIWAWNMLTTETTTPGGSVIDNNFPLNSGFTAAQAKLTDVRKSLVLITDGENTGVAGISGATDYERIGRINDDSLTPDQKQSYKTQTENDMKTVCASVKSSNIAIYVVALQVNSSSNYYKLLRDDCASGTNQTKADYFFDVNSSAGLKDAFKKIGIAQSYNSLTQ
ncbi:vWA domain-containing protein [Aestuariivirga sp.]|uniref:vWA domain-containing protein n=1 Tax=Aestuariivirga sp. TaxID=2650926 RepID=UPI0025C0AC87|nr:vWA domain-containing protein [Aestuariivirga sp.]MCA3556237.1 VWA domain-containing protein [Aestuariivirga sp.]